VLTINARYANGHRRRELRKRLLAAGAYCAWPACPWPTDWLNAQTTLARHHHDDKFPEVDEIQHASRGGDPLSRENTRLLHRWCNNQRSNKPDPEPRAPRPPIIASNGWGPASGA
jgi:hypothetical protein